MVLADDHTVVRQGIRASVESYSIKRLEPLYDFERDVALRYQIEHARDQARLEALVLAEENAGKIEISREVVRFFLKTAMPGSSAVAASPFTSRT